MAHVNATWYKHTREEILKIETLQTRPWHNWSGSVQCQPQQVAKPASIDALVQLIKICSSDKRHVRVVGSGHSFSPLVQTDDVLISLEQIQGIEKIDTQYHTATVLAGTTLKTVGQALHSHGLAQENLGGIHEQSLAGAISTGTHGTGIRFGSISTQVEGLTLVTATGEILECSPEQNADVFKAAQVSLGTLGIITKVKLRVVPARRLHLVNRREHFSDCLINLERYKQENSHFEFFWFPHTPWVQTRFLNETEAPESKSDLWEHFNQIVVENGAYWLLSECCRLVPPLAKTISTLSALGVPHANRVDYSHRLYVAPRLVCAQAMEYAISAEHAQTVLREIEDCIKEHRFRVHFPLGCRFVKADDIWLSPAYQRDSVYIAAHMYRGMPYKAYFRHLEKILLRYDGRPHWGKIHTLDATRLAGLYPRWHDFRRVRASLDPEGLLLNEYLRELFAVDAPVPSNTQNLFSGC